MRDLQNLPAFDGAGVYALYLIDAKDTPYQGKVPADKPIYIGKAVPEGWRQGRPTGEVTKKLRQRLGEHMRSLEAVGLGCARFKARFAILEGNGLDLISALESTLIREIQSLWNSSIDGFGNHDPGKGRYNQAPSEWDTLHPGRNWADRLQGQASSRQASSRQGIVNKI
ncbi:MAG: Eco29kI family restriction endonuclease [Endozoicomonas sp.]|uniref:Eco29kI family restriction endonuclease n=1 Tax=Endozoicomonas sp. TaxID=1892382 RepID=UPI003D9B4090